MKFSRYSSISRLGLVGVLCLLAGMVVAAPLSSTHDSKSDVPALARERFEVADRAYKSALQRFRTGTAPQEDSMGWARRRAKARLEMTEDKNARVAFLQEYRDELQDQFKQAQAIAKVGIAVPGTVDLAQYNLLEAEIWLSRAKAE